MKKQFFLRNRYLFLADIFLVIIAYAFAVIFVFHLYDFFKFMSGGAEQILASCVFFTLCMHAYGIYKTDWINSSPTDTIRLIVSLTSAAILSSLSGLILSTDTFFLKFNIFASLNALTLIAMLRFMLKAFLKTISYRSASKGKRILIIGAGYLGISLIREIFEKARDKYNVIGFIDDDIKMKDFRIYGAKVLGTSEDIVSICKSKQIDEIIFAIHDISHKQKTRILNICTESGVKTYHITGIINSISEDGKISNIKSVQIEDLLNRSVVSLDNTLIENDIKGKTVLVTGGGGSIGSELCRQIIKFEPKKLVIFDIYENNAFELQNELNKKSPENPPVVLIGSVRDSARLENVFDTYKPDVVFHAAAHKHVPLMEESPGEAIKNNIFGTYNTAVCAMKYNCKRFVLISTDKAVNPTNVMGASKRVCEMIVQAMQKESETEFVSVRFGNVLGSNGSVIPFFKKQIENGGPVTVTHPEITRFFMTIPEAAQLVLQAASYAKGGEIFVLDMGEPVKIYDLAKKMISLSGLEPDKDIKIEFVGLRPGEKLYEELMMNEEGLTGTSHEKIFIGKQTDVNYEQLHKNLELLRAASDSDTEKIKEIVADVVPTYHKQ